MKNSKQQAKQANPEKLKAKKKITRGASPDTDEQSISEDGENFILAAAMKDLIVIDNGKLLQNFDAKVKNGDYEKDVDGAIDRMKTRKEWKEEEVDQEVDKAKKKARKHLIETGLVDYDNVEPG